MEIWNYHGKLRLHYLKNIFISSIITTQRSNFSFFKTRLNTADFVIGFYTFLFKILSTILDLASEAVRKILLQNNFIVF